jgi:hypothetical protein
MLFTIRRRSQVSLFLARVLAGCYNYYSAKRSRRLRKQVERLRPDEAAPRWLSLKARYSTKQARIKA